MSDERPWRLGVLADPEVAPADTGNDLSRTLPDALAEITGDGARWEVSVDYERLPAGHNESHAMVRRAMSWKRDHEVDVVVCVTDLPLRTGRRPVAAELLDHQASR